MGTNEVILHRGIQAHYDGAGTNYVVKTPSGHIYLFYVDLNTDVMYKKSTDGGGFWSAPQTVYTGSVTSLSIWYDRWSGIATDHVHIAYSDFANDDTMYKSLDTTSDTLSGQSTIFAGITVVAGGALSITRARGGTLYCKTCIDAGAEGGFFKSTVIGTSASWSTLTDSETMATQDQWILLPGWGADDNDVMMFFWDTSSSEISRCCYDQSGDTWATIAETSIATSMTAIVATTVYPNFAAAVDITNSQNLLVAWSNVDTASATLRCWKVTESAITLTATSVVASSTDDQGLCAIGIDTDTQDWHVFYCGLTAGSETWTSILNIYSKISTDDGATWGAETQLSVSAEQCLWMVCCPRFDTERAVAAYSNAAGIARMRVIADQPPPEAASGGLVRHPGMSGGING